MTETQTALVGKLQEPAVNSKKYKMITRGLIGVMVVFIGTTTLLIFKSELPIMPLAERTITAIVALVAVFTGTQAANDWKTTDALSKQTQASG